jgi:glycosyltransferase involved in cell wall biosynthesis
VPATVKQGSLGGSRPICVVTTGPDVSQVNGAGIQQHVRYLLEAFAGDPGIDLRSFAITSVRRVEPWVLKGVRLAWNYARLPFAIARCDVVHVNSTIDVRSVLRDSGVLLIAAACGRTTVLQFHGGDVQWLGRLRREPIRGIVAWVLGKADEVLFLSESQAVPFAHAFGLSNWACISNYVPVAAYSGRDRSPHAGMNVLFMSRLHPDKGVLECGDRGGSSASLARGH